MKLRKSASILTGKLIERLTKFSGTGGTALPGLISNRIYPNLLKDLTNDIKKGSVLISGTNGKTTTARILGNILSVNQLSFVHNRAGSNLLRGIAATLINKAKWHGKIETDFGIFEVDEFVLPLALKQIKTKVVVINNLFRDQLDRYGEIETIRDRWVNSLKQLDKDTVVVLNADDPSIAHLGHNLRAKTIYFGLNDINHAFKEPRHASDALKCQNCANFL